ncbi:hypothetical protein BN961_00885 [Afipia felis]|uniref:Uncharacterized protein n=1 Tax=Afipia felis TaxID=1035 RepID=A0A090N6V1_AFIFE|nr:hypothetical protein BN961_00885 [Afipia felis]
MHRERDSEAVSDQDGGALALRDGLIEPRQPVGQLRSVPVVLQHTRSIRECHRPMRLPVVDPGIGQAGEDQKIEGLAGRDHGARRVRLFRTPG